jgi:hypothetical protein
MNLLRLAMPKRIASSHETGKPLRTGDEAKGRTRQPKSGAREFPERRAEGRLFAAQVGEVSPLVDRQGAGENRVMM